MSYTALYRKYRPTKFSEIVGQEHITKTLKNQIISNRVGHAYLLTGGRGTGKTSAAKILARAINCLNPQEGEPCNECEICKAALQGSLTDIVEMDAASNNGVEDIRSIREEVNFLPTVAKYRVYIIDEVDMLSVGAFNALLKTLEEPPEHVKFILATTEPQKLPATILSRCQRFDYKKISAENIKFRLEYICKQSDINITDDALKTISVLAEGAMRDGLSILERCVQEGEEEINDDKVKELVGIPKVEYINKIVNSVIDCDTKETLQNIDNVIVDGKDLNNLIWEIIKYVKDILVFKSSGILNLYNDKELKNIVKRYSVYARVNPTHKERIVYTLQNSGKIVAMTGDGVNDAPAIKDAHVGVGMGITGTDVTKSASDIVLMDDSFSTIVVAVEEGRRIYNNIRNNIVFSLSSNFAEIFTIVIGLFTKTTILLPIYILFIDLVTDSIPSICLSFEKSEDGIMNKKPRGLNKPLFTPFIKSCIVSSAIIETIFVVLTYFINLKMYGQETAMSLALLSMVVQEIVYSISCRNLKESVVKQGLFSNKAMNYGLLLILLIELIVFVTPIGKLISITSIDISLILIVFLINFMAIFIYELIKPFLVKWFKD